MDSPAPVTQTFIHRDMKFVSNNFMAPLSKTPSSDGFHIVQDFLASSPLGFALTHPTRVSAKAIQQIWNHSSIADNGDIFFTYAANTFVITKDVIVKALQLPEDQSAAVSYSETEMREFLTQIGYTGDMRRMGRLVRTKLRKEWNFYFDCIGRCFTNKCSNFDALNHLVQHIGYSLLHNTNFDIASIILEYLGHRISEGKNVYFARFVDLIFKYLCPDIVFENDSSLPVFQLNSRVFRDMIGTDNKLPEGVNVTFLSQARPLLQERLPTVYGSIPRVVIQENVEENPPESNPNSDIPHTNPSTSVKSQHLSVVKSKRIAKSDRHSQSSGLRSSPRLQTKTQGEKRAAAPVLNTQPTLKRRRYTAADSSSDSDNVVLSVIFPSLRTPSKDIPHTSTDDQSSDSSTDRTSSPDAPVDLVTTAVSEDVLLTDTTGIDSGDHDPQEPDSQRASDIHIGHTPQEPSIQSMDVNRVYTFPDEQIIPDNAPRNLSLTERELGLQLTVFSAAQSLANLRKFITGRNTQEPSVQSSEAVPQIHVPQEPSDQSSEEHSLSDDAPLLILPLQSRPMETPISGMLSVTPQSFSDRMILNRSFQRNPLFI